MNRGRYLSIILFCFFFLIGAGDATVSTIIDAARVGSTTSDPTTDTTGRQYTSQPSGGQPSNPAGVIPPVNTTNPVQGAFDVFKKAGNFFGK